MVMLIIGWFLSSLLYTMSASRHALYDHLAFFPVFSLYAYCFTHVVQLLKLNVCPYGWAMVDKAFQPPLHERETKHCINKSTFK